MTIRGHKATGLVSTTTARAVTSLPGRKATARSAGLLKPAPMKAGPPIRGRPTHGIEIHGIGIHETTTREIGIGICIWS